MKQNNSEFPDPLLDDEFGSEANLLEFDKKISPPNHNAILDRYYRACSFEVTPLVIRSGLAKAIQNARFTKSPLWDSRFNGQNHDTWEIIQMIFGHESPAGYVGGVSLHREGEFISLSDFNWFFIRMLAKRGGWTPLGTTPPPSWSESSICATWSGTYGEISDQIIEDDDARNLGAALESILGDIPDEDLVPYPMRELSYLQSISLDSFLGFEPVEVMSGPNKEIVRATASFLTRGSVKLYEYSAIPMPRQTGLSSHALYPRSHESSHHQKNFPSPLPAG